MKLTKELILKHSDRIKSILDEARVKSHTRRSKTGKSYQVKDFERKGKDGEKKDEMRNGPNVLGSKFSKYRTTKSGELVTNAIKRKIGRLNARLDDFQGKDVTYQGLLKAKNRLVAAARARGIKFKRPKRNRYLASPNSD